MDRERLIRERAHAIWEAEGQPHGRHDQHWDQARRDLDGADASPEAAETVTAATGDETPPADHVGTGETAPAAAKPTRAPRAKATVAPKRPRKAKT